VWRPRSAEPDAATRPPVRSPWMSTSASRPRARLPQRHSTSEAMDDGCTSGGGSSQGVLEARSSRLAQAPS
jgi:hypothetical protein